MYEWKVSRTCRLKRVPDKARRDTEHPNIHCKMQTWFNSSQLESRRNNKTLIVYSSPFLISTFTSLNLVENKQSGVLSDDVNAFLAPKCLEYVWQKDDFAYQRLYSLNRAAVF